MEEYVSACSYELLEELWLSYSRVARHFARQAFCPQDREDLTQDIILNLMIVTLKRGEELSRGAIIITARYTWLAFLRDKAKRPLSLNHSNHNGDGREPIETLVDERAVGLDAWLDAKAQLNTQPPKVVDLAAKRVRGDPLTQGERCYLWCHRVRGHPPRPAPDTGIGRFADLIAELVAQDWGSYRIWREQQSMGYQGSRSAVKYHLAGDKAKQWRRESNRRRRLEGISRTAIPATTALPAIPTGATTPT